MPVIGDSRRRVLLNLTDNEVSILAKYLDCSILLVTVEDNLYNLTIGMSLREYKKKISEILRKEER